MSGTAWSDEQLAKLLERFANEPTQTIASWPAKAAQRWTPPLNKRLANWFNKD